MKRLAALLAGVCLTSLLCTATARAEPTVELRDDAAEQPTPDTNATIDLNTASASELERLPGVGPSRAQAILEFRAAHGGFTQVSQLMRIKGIGRAMLRKLRPLVTISALPASATKPLQASR